MRLPNGYGSVCKLSGKRRNPWIVRVTDGWVTDFDTLKQVQQKRIVGYYPTRSAALDALSEYHKNPYNIDSANVTFAEIYDKWSAEKFSKISDSNVKGYAASYKSCTSLYTMPFKDIKTAHLQAVIDNSGKNYPTLRKLRVLLNQLYQYAMSNDVVSKNYAEYIDIGINDGESSRTPLSSSELQQLWDNLDRMPYVDTVIIMCYTGWRIGELLDMRIDNVDMHALTMRGGLKTAAGKNRLVPIHRRIVPLIQRLYDKGGEYLIKGPDGKDGVNYYTYRDTYFNAICEQLAMTHKPHDCRHTFATNMDNAGANKLCIKRIMGHASNDITDKVYTHKDIEQLRQAIELLP